MSGPGGPVRVLLADDLRIVRRAVGRLLSVEPDLEVVGEARDGLEALDLVARLSPDVVVMDVSMPKLNGVEATKRIRDEFPAVKVVGLSTHAADYMAGPMLEAGAATYLDNSMPVETLPVAIRLAAREQSGRAGATGPSADHR